MTLSTQAPSHPGKEHDCTPREAAIIIGVERVVSAIEKPGIFP